VSSQSLDPTLPPAEFLKAYEERKKKEAKAALAGCIREMSATEKAELEKKVYSEHKSSNQNRKESSISNPNVVNNHSNATIEYVKPTGGNANQKNYPIHTAADSSEHSDSEDPEVIAALQPRENDSQYIPLNFTSAVEMLFYFDDNLRLGIKSLHPWQEEILEFLSKPHGTFTFQQALRFVLVAANGSGKDVYVISKWSLFFILCKVRSRIIITSSSYNQLHTQTESYIRAWAQKINIELAKEGVCEKALIIKKQHIVCTLTGSEIIMFVTDEPGKAEGYHPFDDYPAPFTIQGSEMVDNAAAIEAAQRKHPGGELAIILNEAKSISKDIYDSLSRCTYNYWLEVSTPSGMSGEFFKHFVSAKKWEDGPYEPEYRYSRTVTSYDCPHISRQKIEQDKKDYGENSAVFRSKHLALFTSVDEMVVVSRESIERCERLKPDFIDLGIGPTVGLDFAASAGGDYNVFTACLGNKVIRKDRFREADTTVTANRALKWLNALKSDYNSLKPENVNADDGNIGHSIIDMIRKAGWDINRVLNQSSAFNTHEFGNRGAELYFSFKRLIEEGIFCFHAIEKEEEKITLLDQLSNRHFKSSGAQGKLILESKAEARANGHGSPDDADSLVLAYANIRIHMFMDKIGTKVISQAKVTGIISQESLVSLMAAKRTEALNLAKGYTANGGLLNNSNPCNILRSLYEGN